MRSALQLLQEGLKEDAPLGDISSLCLNLTPKKTMGYLIAKQDLSFSGQEFIFALKALDFKIDFEIFFNDSERIKKGQKIASLFGFWTDLVLVERTLLNIICHLSGIATFTYQCQQQIKHTKCKILDTRKTIPGLRSFEKKAVIDGGGMNHRMNLSDEIMFKENHILMFSQDLISTLKDVRQRYPGYKITVECQDIKQVQLVSQTMIDQILLDNMDNKTLAECVKIVPEHIFTEASGNMSLERLKSVAETGVDFISMGAITHSAPVADISFLIE